MGTCQDSRVKENINNIKNYEKLLIFMGKGDDRLELLNLNQEVEESRKINVQNKKIVLNKSDSKSAKKHTITNSLL
ncbi:hypothetical protein BpHYR1_039693 [Brachionus plicatilis]|uniref:Uncharacterized protein n=1 Tax=Brachionus plicatilis TaxID=10195 RepID=A0A3M7QCV2_BRAPC|nr:hypothetical protein BpHYR1_039693 [Brachionus plicatilis]